MIDTYLTKRVRSMGGWAPVTEPELIELVEIIDKLIKTKYGPDEDGDYPVDYYVIDRTTCEPMHFQSLPYPPRGKATSAREIMTESIRFEAAHSNLEIAMEQMRSAIHPVRGFVQELAQNAAEMESERQQDNSPVDRLGV